MSQGDYLRTLLILGLMLIAGAVMVTIFYQAFTGEPFLLSSVSWNGAAC